MPFKTQHILTLLIIFLYACSYGQQTEISGNVFDKVSGEPIPFVNIVFKQSTVGTITDINGIYHLITSKPKDSLFATCLGYKPISKLIIENETQQIDFYLELNSTQIDEIIVTPGENPAFALLDNIKLNRKRNNPDNLDSYQYKAYTKLRVDLNNVSPKAKERMLIKKFGFVFDNIDSSETFGKNYLPALISESVSHFYSGKDLNMDKEVIEAFKISGIQNNTFSQFSGKMYQRINVYDNYIQLFEPGFVSPIADFGRMFYKYRLEDSANIDNSWCYKISFKPKRQKERTFYGYMWVADTSWALKKIQLRVSSDVNINFMNDLIAVNEWQKVNDSTWFLSQEDIMIDFNLGDKAFGLFGRKTAAYTNILVNEPIPAEIVKLNTNTYANEDSVSKPDNYWIDNRLVDLEPKEEHIYEMVDSIKNVPMYRTLYGLVELLVEYHYVVGPFEIGPYYTFYSNNPVEGHRLKFGARTSKELSTKYRLGGHVAYGTKDEKWKYGLYGECLLDRNPRKKLLFDVSHDIVQLGKSHNAFLDDNIMTTLLRRRPNYKLTMVDDYVLGYEHEWFHGLTNTLQINHRIIHSSDSVPFNFLGSEEAIGNRNITTTEFTLKTHFAYREKFLLGKYDRRSLGTEFPVLDVDITYAPKDLMGSEFEYLKLKATVYDKIETNPVGYTKYWINAGKVFGNVPYPLLELHRGNETYAYDIYAFNMMNYYEFVSDQYVSLTAEQHFQGFLLNRIPLLKKLEMREVVSTNILFGSLSKQNQQYIDLPTLNYLNKPYIEATAGIENIFKLFRLDVAWRLTYKDNPGIQTFSLRATMQVTF